MKIPKTLPLIALAAVLSNGSPARAQAEKEKAGEKTQEVTEKMLRGRRFVFGEENGGKFTYFRILSLKGGGTIDEGASRNEAKWEVKNGKFLLRRDDGEATTEFRDAEWNGPLVDFSGVHLLNNNKGKFVAYEVTPGAKGMITEASISNRKFELRFLDPPREDSTMLTFAAGGKLSGGRFDEGSKWTVEKNVLSLRLDDGSEYARFDKVFTAHSGKLLILEGPSKVKEAKSFRLIETGS
ncbi:hypothetical protein [Luteolibacter sp. Populi]|uniref:hypothetical protein n=1 Tax=Luteolibacter sp. Populi TaxID=3230487 RepID=UPI00346627B8